MSQNGESDVEYVDLKTKLNAETAKIAWRELQRFFAQGRVLQVSSELDLVAAGCEFACDNKQQVDAWVQQEKIAQPADEQAQRWYEEDQYVWALVIAPWVLIQEV